MERVAAKCRLCLLGTHKEVTLLRNVALSEPDISDLPCDEIDRDLKRTFPTEIWFTDHIRQIRNVLLWYSWTNPACGYCQSYTYITFVLYKILCSKSKRHAMIDTYYCLHKLNLLIKPLLPKDSKDSKPLSFTTTLRCLILLEMSQIDRELYIHLRENNIVEMTIIKGLPCLFLNWYTLDEDIKLLEYIVDRQSSVMFKRLMNFLLAFFVVNRELFIYFSYEKTLEIMDTYIHKKFSSILLLAKSLE